MVEDKLKAALIAEFNAIPPREELEKMYTFSERHNKMMEAIFVEMRRRERFESYFRAVRRVAIVMLALIGCAVVSLKVVPTVYAYVEAWITENADDRLIFKDKDTKEDSGEKEELRFELGYVPEGYELVGETHIKTGVYVIYYENYEGTILQLVCYGKSGENQLSVNIEGILVEEIVVDGVKYSVFENEDNSIVVAWKDSSYLFRLDGVFDETEMLNIAIFVRIVGDK